MADQISDAILDAMIKGDPNSRVAVETLITTGQVHVAGEVTTSTYVDIPGLIRDKILEIGYDSSAKGYDGASCGVSCYRSGRSRRTSPRASAAYEHREARKATRSGNRGGDQA
jgi:S-adenosylmethionine synthetase